LAVLFKVNMKFTQMLKKKDFKKIFSCAKSISAKSIVMLCMKNDTDENRLGIVASKKTGNSVKRNSARRRIREIYRINEINLSKGYDIVIIAKPAIHEESFAQLQKSILKCFMKFKILDNNNK